MCCEFRVIWSVTLNHLLKNLPTPRLLMLKNYARIKLVIQVSSTVVMQLSRRLGMMTNRLNRLEIFREIALTRSSVVSVLLNLVFR